MSTPAWLLPSAAVDPQPPTLFAGSDLDGKLSEFVATIERIESGGIHVSQSSRLLEIVEEVRRAGVASLVDAKDMAQRYKEEVHACVRVILDTIEPPLTGQALHDKIFEIFPSKDRLEVDVSAFA